MSRPTRRGGGAMRKPKASVKERLRREAADPDAVDYRSIDWDSVEPETIELDPALVERIRARGQLQPITLRVGAEQVAEARRDAARTGPKSQAVLRRCLADG